MDSCKPTEYPSSETYVPADFARELEREVARLRYALKELVEQCRTGDDISAWWRVAVDNAEAALASLPNVKSAGTDASENTP